MSGSVVNATVHGRQCSPNPTQKMNDFGASTEKCESNNSRVFWNDINEGRDLHCHFRKGKQ